MIHGRLMASHRTRNWRLISGESTGRFLSHAETKRAPRKSLGVVLDRSEGDFDRLPDPRPRTSTSTSRRRGATGGACGGGVGGAVSLEVFLL